MASGFTLSIYPWVYTAHHEEDGKWTEEFTEKPHKSAQEEAGMATAARNELLARRNSFPELPLVNYTSQYGLGCFEGLKALPQPDGSLKIFRPGENAARMARSMKGLMMPEYPADLFVRAVTEVVRRNQKIGFAPVYDKAWEKEGFQSGHAVYIRPFSYSEPAIGLGLSHYPWVVMVSTPVGSYFDPDISAKAVTSTMSRATPGGTGWIKCDANYVIPILAKKRAEKDGFMEAIFLDSREHRYVEEGSSCNIFFLLKSGKLATPSLEDRVLPGVTRKSTIVLAQDLGIAVEERPIAIDEVMSDATECFVTGTAAGVAHIESITHNGKESVFNGRKIGEVTRKLQWQLKGIQYGAVPDTHGWMTPV